MVAADYRAFGKFSPVYDHAIEHLYQLPSVPVDRARQTEKVLRAYVEHASNVGTCYPSVRRIMEKTHYSETTVKRALVVLGQLDYMRVHREYSPARRRTMETYQVSPYVMWITAEHIGEAEVLWNSTSLRCNEIIHEQPESESESEPSLKTRISQPESEPPPPSERYPEPKSNIIPLSQRNAPDQPAGQKQSKQHEVPDQQRHAPALPQPGVPPKPLLETCKTPLPDAREEALAQELKTDVNTRIAQARQLVKQFGYSGVRDGLGWLKIERQNNKAIKSEFGLLKWWLSNGAILADDAPRQPTMSGKYADFFES